VDRLAVDRTLLMVKKEILQLSRNRRVLFIAFMMPVMIMTLIGLGFTSEIKNIFAIVINEDGRGFSTMFLDALRQTDALKIKYYANDLDEAENLIKNGQAKAAILIPKSFDENFRSGQAYVYVVVDGSDPMSASKVLSSVQAVAQSFSPKIVVRTSNIVLFNPTLRYIEFMAPAVVGFVLQMFPIMTIAVAIAGERERGTIEQLIVTPISSLDVLLGKMIVYMGIGLTNAFFMMAVAVYAFKLTIRGNVFLIALFIFIFLAASLSLGILSSAISKTQLQAIQTLMPFIIPTAFLSGTFYPIESMPNFIQPISYCLPLTYMIHAMRSVMVKGGGIEIIATDLLALTIYAVAINALAVTAFRKKL
jgi:ABC-2 type transport system permease protein